METICAIDGNAPGCEPTPNHAQAAPKLVSAASNGHGLDVKGELDGQANTLYRVELFANPNASDTEAERYVGFLDVPVDASGHARFTYPVDAAVAATAANFTATATTNDGATSMLSAPLAK